MSNPKFPEGTRAFYGQFVRAGDLCFDIGAHWGSCTDAFLALGARVICVEPQPRIVQMLRAKYSNNHRVSIVPKGVLDKPGIAPMFISERDSTVSSFTAKWKTGRFRNYTNWNVTLDIPVTTLDELVQTYGCPQFCKIDVEGGEHQVVQGLSSPIPFISFEFTREFLDDAELCMRRLAALGDVELNYSLAASMQLVLPRWARGQEVLACLQSSEDDSLWGDIYARYNR